jgi:K+-sensing histidine kinase KdpD
MARMREANEHLVVAAVRAQTQTEEAETASHLKDEFLTAVSHEIRTPLNAILGWAQTLESRQLPPERTEHAIAAIGRSASALAHLIDDLLDTSRILKGGVRLALRPVDLAAIAEGALEAVRPLAATRNVHLAFDAVAVAGSRTVIGDADRLQQVFWNLLTNAIKFTPEGGRVDVLIDSANDHMEVRVVDTGCGISPDFLPHVFERSARPTMPPRNVTPGWGSVLASSGHWWSCTGERCMRPAPAWDTVRRSRFVCRWQPGVLPQVNRLRRRSDEPGARPRASIWIRLWLRSPDVPSRSWSHAHAWATST